MMDFSAWKAHFKRDNLHCFSFSLNLKTPLKLWFALQSPAEDIHSGLVQLGFDIITIKQMSANCLSAAEGTSTNHLPLFPDNLDRIFQLPSLCHISNNLEVYKAQNAHMQCYNSQEFGNVWANCKQPPHCLWCGNVHLHKDSPETGNALLTSTCCNCQLAEEWHSPPTTGAAGMWRKRCERESSSEHPRIQLKGCSLQILPPQLPFRLAPQGNSEQKKRPHFCQEEASYVVDSEA